jgi:hypothetical protein
MPPTAVPITFAIPADPKVVAVRDEIVSWELNGPSQDASFVTSVSLASQAKALHPKKVSLKINEMTVFDYDNMKKRLRAVNLY